MKRLVAAVALVPIAGIVAVTSASCVIPSLLAFSDGSGKTVASTLVPSNDTYAWAIHTGCDPSTPLDGAFGSSQVTFTESQYPQVQSVTLYDQRYGLGSCDNGGSQMTVNDAIQGNWACLPTHFVTVPGGSNTAVATAADALPKDLPNGVRHAVRNIDGTCRVTLPLGPILESFVNSATPQILNAEAQLPFFLSSEYVLAAQPQFQSAGRTNNNGIMFAGDIRVSGPPLGTVDITVDGAFGLTVAPTLPSTAAPTSDAGADGGADGGAPPAPSTAVGQILITELQGTVINVPPEVVAIKAEIPGLIISAINSQPNTVQTTINNNLKVPVTNILSTLKVPIAKPATSGELTSCSSAITCYTVAHLSLSVAAAKPSPLQTVQKAAFDSFVQDNFTCDTSICNFHPIIQAINVRPQTIELVLSPSVADSSSLSTDSLTTFYRAAATLAPTAFQQSANLGGGVWLTGALDCSTPPPLPSSGTIATVVHGNSDLATQLGCGGIGQSYWVDNNVSQFPARRLQAAATSTPLVGYAEDLTPGNAPSGHYVGLIGSDGDVHEFSASGSSSWGQVDLTSTSSSKTKPVPGGPLDAYLDAPIAQPGQPPLPPSIPYRMPAEPVT